MVGLPKWFGGGGAQGMNNTRRGGWSSRHGHTYKGWSLSWPDDAIETPNFFFVLKYLEVRVDLNLSCHKRQCYPH
jgi:hypothetical protein